jgi:hypothetical protein
MQEELETPQHDALIFKRRLLIGLVQGVLLFILLRTQSMKLWPSTAPLVFAPMAGIALLVPPLLIVSCGHIPLRRLVRYLLPVVLAIAFVAGYAEWRWDGALVGASRAHAGFAIGLMFPLLFIVWTLIQAHENEQHWPASYAAYFEAAWKLAIQHLFVMVFVGTFWLVVWLGVGLFMMLKIDFLRQLIGHDWFWLPATTLVMACGFHLTDMRPGIVSGIRNLLLTMLSWLLPLLACLVAAFLVAIPLAGFELLWNTRFATSLLLGTCIVLVVLINTAFQDGNRGEQTHMLLRHAMRLASLLLLPLTLIASYALSLRVGQYGWSPDRVQAALCIGVALAYAGGYLWAILDPQGRTPERWLPRIAVTNIYASVLVVALGLAVLTPLADPARVSVSSQLSMLQSGQTPAERFDFKFLRFEGVRYGRAALDALAADSNPAISEKAKHALALKSRWEKSPVLPLALSKQLSLRTPGKIWPQGFLDAGWESAGEKWRLPLCLREENRHCDVFVGAFSGTGRDEVLLIPQDHGTAALFSDSDGSWRLVSSFELPGKCLRLRDDLAIGKFRAVPPQGMDLMVGETRLRAVRPKIEQSKCE